MSHDKQVDTDMDNRLSHVRPFNLLGLPIELRVMVYAQYFRSRLVRAGEAHQCIWQPVHWAPMIFKNKSIEIRDMTSLLLVSKQICQESRSVMFDHITFVIYDSIPPYISDFTHWTWGCTGFWDQRPLPLPQRLCDNINHAQVTIDAFHDWPTRRDTKIWTFRPKSLHVQFRVNTKDLEFIKQNGARWEGSQLRPLFNWLSTLDGTDVTCEVFFPRPENHPRLGHAGLGFILNKHSPIECRKEQGNLTEEIEEYSNEIFDVLDFFARRWFGYPVRGVKRPFAMQLIRKLYGLDPQPEDHKTSLSETQAQTTSTADLASAPYERSFYERFLP